MKLNEIRNVFLNYFKNHGHTIVPSSSLIPSNDNTLLFTNAGMNQFKDVFLGIETRNYNKAVSSQKCLRAGGKHNDLENVGYTSRHHTFFEMLGNFSFGDYFKEEAIKYAWSFLTKELQLKKDRLYVTVYHTDIEAYNIWHKLIKLPQSRIIKIYDKSKNVSDNFWQMGDIGPCGPCTEIFYDHGDKVYGGLPGTREENGDRYVEIWNCVFMQYNKDEHGILHNLPKPSVDTGMGLERIAAVLQNVTSNYDIDLFSDLINSATQITNVNDFNNPSLKVLADHIRAVSFLISDGVIPGNENREYVLRRIIRRAIRHGYKLGVREPFFYKLVDTLIKLMGNTYIDLQLKQRHIENTLLQEEERFLNTIHSGMDLLKASIVNQELLDGAVAFKLYDTYGFPLDLTIDICKEHNIIVDEKKFNELMLKQRESARNNSSFKASKQIDLDINNCEFLGYGTSSISDAKVLALLDHHNQAVNELTENQSGTVILDKTVFYPESGGQIGDSGIIHINGGSELLFKVQDTQKIKENVFAHIGVVEKNKIKLNDLVVLNLDFYRRMCITRNHSVTHLLHKALQEVLGSHALQKGSLINETITRFDFAHDKPLSIDEIERIERIVNLVIIGNYEVNVGYMSYNEAVQAGVMALFNDKYQEKVRVVSMGKFSKELCGGTHVMRTGDIGFFKIVSESGISQGVRRIEAVTGEVALKESQKKVRQVKYVRELLKAQTEEVIDDKIINLINQNKELVQDVNSLKNKLAIYKVKELLANAIDIDDIKIIIVDVSNNDVMSLIDNIKSLPIKVIAVLGHIEKEKANITVFISRILNNKYSANIIIKDLLPFINGKGGGKSELAKGSGDNLNGLKDALKKAQEILS